jgi:hypothetical protein
MWSLRTSVCDHYRDSVQAGVSWRGPIVYCTMWNFLWRSGSSGGLSSADAWFCSTLSRSITHLVCC